MPTNRRLAEADSTLGAPSKVMSAVVKVWQVALAQPPSVVAAAAQCLTPDEHERAARFYFDRDRQRYVLARAALRRVLGDRLGMAAGAVRFAYAAAGKPALAPELASDSLSFNLSHSHEVALVAVAGGERLGVDVEYQRTLPDLADLARRFFAPNEAARLLRLPPDEQPAAFVRCWTRKEAYIKALGDGLAAGLDGFEVSFAPGEPPALLRVHADPAEAAHWTLLAVEPGPGYAGAVAVRAPGATLEVATWVF